MKHNATHGIVINIPIDISSIDKRINDNDLVYIDNRSLKIVPSDEENIGQIQESLQQQLQENLNRAGRIGLAERSVKQPITYKTLSVLICQINSPRTASTLSTNITKQFPASMESLPDFVKQDMKDKKMRQLPKNIHTLYFIANHFPSEQSSLPLIKHITTQCLGIDFDSSFETLEEECIECTLLLTNSLSNLTITRKEIDCIAILSGLKNILRQQNKIKWEQITLPQPTTRTCLKCLFEKNSIDQPHESELLPIDDRDKTDDASSSEPLHSDKESTIAEKTTEKTPSPSDKMKSKDTPPQTQKSQNTATIPLQKPAVSKQIASASFRGARPKETITLPDNPKEDLQEGLRISNQSQLNSLVVYHSEKLQKDYQERETLVENFIKEPKSCNKNLYTDAIDALNRGFWAAGKYFDLLNKASSVSDQPFFADRLNLFVENGYFLIGYPPHNVEENRTYMTSTNKLSNKLPYFQYILPENTTPTEAMDSCYKDFWLMDQGTIIDFTYSLTLRSFLGIDIFNKYFTKNPLTLETVAIPTPVKSQHATRWLMRYKKEANLFVKGNLYSFNNHKKYEKRDFNGEYSSIHAICTDEKKLLFCTPELFANASIHDIHTKLVDLYNQQTYNERMVSKKIWHEFSVGYSGRDCPISISLHDLLHNKTISLYMFAELNFADSLAVKESYHHKITQQKKRKLRRLNIR